MIQLADCPDFISSEKLMLKLTHSFLLLLFLVNNLFAAYPLIKDTLKLLGVVTDWERDDEGNVSIFKKYQRDTGMYEKGDYKIFGKLDKIGIHDNPLKLLYPKTMLENFEKASDM